MTNRYIDFGEDRYINSKNIELIHKIKSTNKNTKEDVFVVQTTGGFRFTCRENESCYNEIIRQLQNSNYKKPFPPYYDHYDGQVYSDK